jgi:hypothetical protein
MAAESTSVIACPPVALQLDDRAGQCARAANYIETHPGCSLVELAIGADLGSATKVVSEMPRFGYRLRKVRDSIPCVDGTRTRRGAVRYFLEARPKSPQRDLFEGI